jgi:formylglycine-generating enzyme required for sulfatase activity
MPPVVKQDEKTSPATKAEKLTSPPPTIASSAPILNGQDKTSPSFTQEQRSTDEVTSTSPMLTIQASTPERAFGDNQNEQNAPFAYEVPPTIHLTQTHPAGGKRWTLIVGGLLVVIIVGAIIWFAKRTTTQTTSPSSAQPQMQQPTAEQQTPTGQSFTENINGVGIDMVSVPGGTFLMGSPLSETGRDRDEGPQNEVSVQSFYLGKDEVTQAQYQAVMGTNPSSFKGDDLPVDSVTWSDAVEFCRKLSKMTGREYRLPTEAEWEYAARAGTSGPYAGDIDAMAWDAANSDNRTHPVGQKQPNGFGLYDMYGNVWEWCQSKYQPYPYNANDGREDVQGNDVRVMRGGSWLSAAIYCRSAYRRRVIPDLRSVGFRIVLAAQ